MGRKRVAVRKAFCSGRTDDSNNPIPADGGGTEPVSGSSSFSLPVPVDGSRGAGSSSFSLPAPVDGSRGAGSSSFSLPAPVDGSRGAESGSSSLPADGDIGVDVPVKGAKPSVSRAECWKHMNKREIIDDGIKSYIAICHYCKTELSTDSARGTGHLNRHFKACLKKAGKTFGASMQTQLNSVADGTVSTWVYNPQLAREEIIKYIVSEDLPIMMGESPNFKNLIQRAFFPQYQPVSRTTIKSDLMSQYHKQLAVLKENFKKVQFSFALTSDIWTSSHQKTSYISVVAHYLDNSYCL
jgi:hypothetical protein